MLSKSYWLGLKSTTRQSLKILLDIPKTGGSEVYGNTVVSDGFTDSDLATVTLPKLQEFMQSDDTDFYGLLGTLISRIEAPIELPPQAPVSPQGVEERLSEVEHQVADLNPSNKVLYAIPQTQQLPVIKKKAWGRPKGAKVVNGKLITK
jgi:hypothetical protein